MGDSEQYILPPEVEAEIGNFYNMAFKKNDYQSPIYTDLKSIERHFSNKQLLSCGGMKHIYIVDDHRTARPIVMAELKKNGVVSQEDIEQFLREARITAALEHPNIVPIYDIGLNREGKPFFTMKFLRGESLKQIVRELLKANPGYVRRYSLNILLDIYLKVCEAVAFAHSCGIIHLDIKPDNIIIGNYGEVYLCDWGLAKLLDLSDAEQTAIPPLDENILNDITLYGIVKGTPGYMAPEQIHSRFGEKNKQTDIYALGALLYTILGFRQPFDGLKIDDIIEATLDYKLVPPKEMTSKEIPESLNAICMKAMAKDQKDRYGSVNGLISDIRSYQQGFATEAEEVTPLKALSLLLKRNKLLSMVILLVVVTGLLMAGVLGNMLERTKMKASRELELIRTKHKQEVKKSSQLAARKVEKMNVLINKYEKGLAKSEAEKNALIANFMSLPITKDLKVHLDAGDINNDGGTTNPADGATLSAWKSIEGRGLVFDQTGGATVPPTYTVSEATVNYKPVVTFSGQAGEWLANGDGNTKIVSGSTTTFFIVARLTTNDDAFSGIMAGWKKNDYPDYKQHEGFCIIDRPDTTDGISISSHGVSMTVVSINSPGVTDWMLLEVHSDGANIRVYREGELIDKKEQSNRSLGFEYLYLGARHEGRDGSDIAADSPHACQFAEIIMYARALSDKERERVGFYLQRKYGISGSYKLLSSE